MSTITSSSDIWKSVLGLYELKKEELSTALSKTNVKKHDHCKVVLAMNKMRKASDDFTRLMQKSPPPTILPPSQISSIKLESLLETWLCGCKLLIRKYSTSEEICTIDEQLDLLDNVYDRILLTMKSIGHEVEDVPTQVVSDVTLDPYIFPYHEMVTDSVSRDMLSHPEWFK